MCGIFGFATFEGRSVPPGALDRCVRTLKHRGPDAQGVVGWDETGARYLGQNHHRGLVLGLGHRRLAIFDLSDAGVQPMKGNDGEWIVYNGEIYNFLELRKELSQKGYRFTTQTDTEVILAAYEEWGPDCVTRFNGMWAFAIYDETRGGFFWSRDRLGIKPFYYSRQHNLICFSSEPQAIFPLLDRTPPIDKRRLASYLVFHRCDDGEDTIYRGVRELRGGHSAWLDLDTGELRTWQYWSLPTEHDFEIEDDEALDRFSELFEDAVRLRLRADVPVAVTLSGGIDSSAVTVAASRVGPSDLLTFTSSFPEHSGIDETAYAREVAQACGARPVLIEPDLSRLVAEEPLLTRHQAMPYISLSLYVHWAILTRIREHDVPVVLSGQGGDELFLGYERYYVAWLLTLWPNVPLMLARGIRASLRSRLTWTSMAAYLAYFGSPRLRQTSLLRRAGKVYHPELLAGPWDQQDAPGHDLRDLQARELLGGQLSRLLRYDDRTAGAHGMETRLPFLDYRLVEFACRLPWKHKIRRGWTKYLVRRYLGRHLSKTVAWRKCKLGFNAPNRHWTDRLIRHRGRDLEAHPLREALLQQRVHLRQVPAEQRWKVYNILQLATLLQWTELAG